MKIALIGGGSVRTVYFVQSLAKFAPKLGINKVCVMDNDPNKLKVFGTLAKHVIGENSQHLEFEMTDNLDVAVEDADYVVTTMRVGQDRTRCMDEKIALTLGLIGQETTGAGGFSYAMRSIPAMLECCEAVKKAGKNAIIFNFTNPSGLVTQAMHDAGYDNVIGICDNATGIKMDLSHALNINANEIFVKIYGLNHLSWANEVVVDDVNILDKLIDNEHFLYNFHQFEYFDRDLIKQIRQIPNGYLYYYYHREKALANMLKSPKTRGESIADINEEMFAKLLELDLDKEQEKGMEIFHKYMQIREGSYMKMELGNQVSEAVSIDIDKLGIKRLDKKNETVEVYEGYAGVAFNYIESVNKNIPIDLALSVKNNGAINGLLDSDVVEITCMIDKNGATPVNVGDVPEDSLLLIQQIKHYERLAVKAIRERSKELAIRALMVNPLVSSYSLAKTLVNEYTKLNEPYTGEWK